VLHLLAANSAFDRWHLRFNNLGHHTTYAAYDRHNSNLSDTWYYYGPILNQAIPKAPTDALGWSFIFLSLCQRLAWTA
jgi:hypothetical protein